jgi:hypothetical protein
MIAIDDITYKENLCNFVPPTTTTLEPTTPYPKSVLDCDFEGRNMCGWKSERDAKFSWLLNRGRTPTSFTGPTSDHTTFSDSGTYIYIESGYPLKVTGKHEKNENGNDRVKMFVGFGIFYSMPQWAFFSFHIFPNPKNISYSNFYSFFGWTIVYVTNNNLNQGERLGASYKPVCSDEQQTGWLLQVLLPHVRQ